MPEPPEVGDDRFQTDALRHRYEAPSEVPEKNDIPWGWEDIIKILGLPSDGSMSPVADEWSQQSLAFLAGQSRLGTFQSGEMQTTDEAKENRAIVEITMDFPSVEPVEPWILIQRAERTPHAGPRCPCISIPQGKGLLSAVTRSVAETLRIDVTDVSSYVRLCVPVQRLETWKPGVIHVRAHLLSWSYAMLEPDIFDSHCWLRQSAWSALTDQSLSSEEAVERALLCYVKESGDLGQKSFRRRRREDDDSSPKASSTSASSPRSLPASSSREFFDENDGDTGALGITEKDYFVTLRLEMNFNILERIGRGCFSTVHRAEDLPKGTQVAVKIVPEKHENSYWRELNALHALDHPNIVRLGGAYVLGDPPQKMCFTMELVTGKDFFRVVAKEGPRSESAALGVMSQILGAVDYMHSQQVIHRDLKPDNVLCVQTSTRPVESIGEGIDEDASHDIKLIDFGLACFDWQETELRRRCGTPGYIAPEVLQGGRYTCKIDCFACGCVLYYILFGKQLFHCESAHETLQQNSAAEIDHEQWSHLSSQLQGLLAGLLEKDPSCRLSTGAALEAIFFEQRIDVGL